MKPVMYATAAEGGDMRQRHFVGLPPELTAGQYERGPMPRARVLIASEQPDNSFFLLRYARDGNFAGDTWHQSLGEVKEQAAFEYGDLLSDWEEVPPNTPDALKYALEQVSRDGQR
jgi:hypothetical protein